LLNVAIKASKKGIFLQITYENIFFGKKIFAKSAYNKFYASTKALGIFKIFQKRCEEVFFNAFKAKIFSFVILVFILQKINPFYHQKKHIGQ